MQDFKKTIVEKIQKGLTDSFNERQQLGLSINNHPWVSNYNYIFSYLLELHGHCGILVYQFQRYSYKMICIYLPEEKTIFTICSEQGYTDLMKRTKIERFHFSDAFCTLSEHEGSITQTNMFGEEIEIITREDLTSLLSSISVNFPSDIIVNEYCMLACRFDHYKGQLYRISGHYMSKDHSSYKLDDSWNQYITIVSDTLSNTEQNVVAPDELSVDITVKPNAITLKKETINSNLINNN